MRLIDADALLSERMRSMYYHLPNGDIAIPLIDIEHAPTVDQPRIVRCKDCRKRNLDNCPFYDITDTIAPDEWFCPAGEKRETLGV